MFTAQEAMDFSSKAHKEAQPEFSNEFLDAAKASLEEALRKAVREHSMNQRVTETTCRLNLSDLPGSPDEFKHYITYDSGLVKDLGTNVALVLAAYLEGLGYTVWAPSGEALHSKNPFTLPYAVIDEEAGGVLVELAFSWSLAKEAQASEARSLVM